MKAKQGVICKTNKQTKNPKAIFEKNPAPTDNKHSQKTREELP